MAEASIKFFLQRLDSLLLEEAQTFTGLEDQILWLKSILSEVEQFFKTQKDDSVHGWMGELTDAVHNMDDCIDEFIIQMENLNGSDRTELIDGFRTDLQKVQTPLAEIIDKMYRLEDPTTTKESAEHKENTSKIDEGDTSSSASFISSYRNLPYYLRSCLMYCCIFPENHWIPKGRLIRLLVAEGLIQERPGEVLEDIAEDNIEKLVCLGIVQVVEDHPSRGSNYSVPKSYRDLSLGAMEKEGFITACTSSDIIIPPKARRVSIHSDSKNIPTNLKNLPIRSLLMFEIQGLSAAEWNCLIPVFHSVKLLRVLDLEDVKIERLPDEVGDLIHLRYLGLNKTDLDELPESLSNLRNLQTLDIRWCGKLTTLPSGILNLLRLRHIKMFKNMDVCGMKVSAGIGRLHNLLTFTGLYVGDGIASELGSLTQLRRLKVIDVAEDHASELCASIMKMGGLLSLTLEAKSSFPRATLPPLEPFLPPPLLRKLCLEGCLGKLPNWFGMMESLTKLRLGFSHLSENPALVLQFLPNLKNLSLWNAHDAKQIGKEFCKKGGFPKLEDLSIASHVLEEWTELEEGALPSLKYLHIHNCLKLRTLPEGLQYVTTLQQLDLLPLLDDHEERLRRDGGEENYKIKHIPTIRFITISMLAELSQSPVS